MANLVYYSKEKEEFKEAFEKKLEINSAEMIYKKLCRHWKISPTTVQWTSGRNHPHAGWGITLNKDWNNFGVLCHEFAHHYCQRKLSNHGHNKVHWKFMKRMINYCRKKNWFEEELKRRIEPKWIRLKTDKEIRQDKIKRLEESTKRCISKIKRYQNLIKKNNRKTSALKRFF